MTIYVPTSSNGYQDFPWDPSARQTFSRSKVPYPYLSNLDFANTFPGIPEDNFALAATSTIDIGAGSHRFCTTSDDGSWLYVDGALVVDNHGLHGPTTVCQNIQLSGGFHTITINFFERLAGQRLEVSIDGTLTAPAQILDGPGPGKAPTQSWKGKAVPGLLCIVCFLEFLPVRAVQPSVLVFDGVRM